MDIQAFAVAMAEALDGSWSVEPGNYHSRARCLLGPGRERVHVLYSDWETKPRLYLSADLPAELRVLRHRYGNPVPLHEITVSADKTPRTVAAETSRRLLPAYRVTLAESLRLQQRLADEAIERDTIARSVAAALGAVVQHPRPDAATGHDPRNAVVSYSGPLAGTATVTCRSEQVAFAFTVHADRAAQAAALLASFPATHQAPQANADSTVAVSAPSLQGFTRDNVCRAINDGADLVRDALAIGDREHDLINLVVNAALGRLDAPDADLDQIILENYHTDPSEVRRWCCR